MMSLQRPMHSSQMYTVGPAMSFFTSFCDLPPKEQLRLPFECSSRRRSTEPSVRARLTPIPLHWGSAVGSPVFRVERAVAPDLTPAHTDQPPRLSLPNSLARSSFQSREGYPILV